MTDYRMIFQAQLSEMKRARTLVLDARKKATERFGESHDCLKVFDELLEEYDSLIKAQTKKHSEYCRGEFIIKQ